MKTRGRHRSEYREMLSASENELEAAWKDGHEAAVEEMEDPSMRGYYLMYFAIQNDVPLLPDQVKRGWDDAFLTNVIVPILEHIKRHDDNMVAQAEVDGELVLEYYYRRRMVDLDHVQDILKEWRG